MDKRIWITYIHSPLVGQNKLLNRVHLLDFPLVKAVAIMKQHEEIIACHNRQNVS